MNNAAFQSAQDPQVELRRILLQVCDALHGMGPIDYIPLIDINGNRVGEYKVTCESGDTSVMHKLDNMHFVEEEADVYREASNDAWASNQESSHPFE